MDSESLLLRELMENQDTAYQTFQTRLLPTLPPQTIIGVRTPILRQLAKQWYATSEAEQFLSTLPHTYFDENQLHALLLERIGEFDAALVAVTRFLPFVDNWATCDMLSPKAFAKEPNRLLPVLPTWLQSNASFTVRFGIEMLMSHFLGELFSAEQAEWVASVSSSEYYVNMMIAWYFATALAKQPEAILPFYSKKSLPIWTHNKAIQKAIESRRIPPDQKAYLRTLKRTEK